jgi:hypothetical protein
MMHPLLLMHLLLNLLSNLLSYKLVVREIVLVFHVKHLLPDKYWPQYLTRFDHLWFFLTGFGSNLNNPMWLNEPPCGGPGTP